MANCGCCKVKYKQCCKEMEKNVCDPRVQISYDPILRNYSITMIYEQASNGSIQIWKCPWCGKDLPSYLGQKYDEFLEQEYGIENGDAWSWDLKTDEKIWNPLVPEEFKSDAWWKNRGL